MLADEQFLQMMPAIKRYAGSLFRNLQPQDRDEATSEVLCSSFVPFGAWPPSASSSWPCHSPGPIAVAHFRAGVASEAS